GTSPLDDRAGPSKAAAEHDHQDVIAAFDSSAAIGFVERDSYGGSRSVAVAVEIHKHFVPGDTEPIGDRFDDAQVGLMRNDTGNVFNGKPRLIESLFRCVEHRYDSLFVHFLSGHVYRRQVHVHIVPCDGAPRTAARHEQNVCVPRVTADVGTDDAMSAASVSQDGSAGAIAKKNATVAIGPVRDRRQFLGPDYKDRFVGM